MRLTVDAHQLTELCEGSGVSTDVVKDAGLYSVDDPKAAAKLLGRRVVAWKPVLPVLVFPYFVPGQRDPVLFRGKPAQPMPTRGREGGESFAKYLSPAKSGTHLYFPPGLLDEEARASARVPLLITEGEKKALSADSHGFACLGLTGVHQWHPKGKKSELHPEFKHLNLQGRDVFIAFDRDALTNHQVKQQEEQLGQALLGAGAKAYVVRFPEDAPKLDDFLVAKGRDALKALMVDARRRGEVKPPPVAETSAPAVAQALTDLGNAERLVRRHGKDLRYCGPLGGWYVWDGKRWGRDETGEVMRRAMDTVRAIYAEAKDAPSAMRDEVLAWAVRSESKGSLKAMVDLAQSMLEVIVTPGQFDADPWALNVLNGIVDLRTGQLRSHRREDLITKLAGADYDPEASHDRWDAFVDTATGGDEAYARFLQASMGYSITGDISEDRLFFVHGPPARGKSALMGAVEGVLGSYAGTAKFSSFVADPKEAGDKARPDLVRLRGLRLVACKEIRANSRIDEGTVKSVTGGDVITVRGLWSDYVEFRPSFKLWLVANDSPVIRAEDEGMWRRVFRLPFDKPVPNPDRTLREDLATDPALMEAVLAWAVAGVALWRSEGLVAPDQVVESSKAYQQEMNPVAGFFEERCVFEPDAKVARRELRSEYEQWCKEEGRTPLGPRRLADALRPHLEMVGYEGAQVRTTVRSFGKVADAWRGVRLLSEAEREARVRWGAGPGCRDVGTDSDFVPNSFHAGAGAQAGAGVRARTRGTSLIDHDLTTDTTKTPKGEVTPQNSTGFGRRDVGCAQDPAPPTPPYDASEPENDGWIG